MLVSIALGIFIAGVIYVTIWSVANDTAKSIEDQTGFIRMRVPKKPRARAAKRERQSAVPQRPEIR
jgi:hypothetical protein